MVVERMGLEESLHGVIYSITLSRSSGAQCHRFLALNLKRSKRTGVRGHGIVLLSLGICQLCSRVSLCWRPGRNLGWSLISLIQRCHF